MSRKNIPWTDPLLESLLNLVIVNGGHIAKASERATLWEKINNEFFALPEASMLEDHYVRGNPRKIRDKYNQVLKQTKEFMASGNTSAMESADTSALFKLSKQIYDEMEEKEEEKEAGVALKRALDDNESFILGGGKHAKTIASSGSSVISSGSRSEGGGKPKRDSFDAVLMSYLENKMNPSKNIERPEDNIEILLEQFCKTNKKDIASLLAEASIKDEATTQILQELGLDTICSIYCSGKFEANNFKEPLKEMGVPPLSYHKLFCIMQKWRNQASTTILPPSPRSSSTLFTSPTPTTIAPI